MCIKENTDFLWIKPQQLSSAEANLEDWIYQLEHILCKLGVTPSFFLKIKFLEGCQWDMRFNRYEIYHLINIPPDLPPWWNLPPYWITIWITDWWCNDCLLDDMILGFCYSNLTWGNQWIWTCINMTNQVCLSRLLITGYEKKKIFSIKIAWKPGNNWHTYNK